MSSANSDGIDDLPLHIAVRNVVRDNIATGHLRPGMLLRESALAGQFSVSRVPVAWALRKLEESGVVERAKRGYRIAGKDTTASEEAPPLNIPQTVVELARGRASWERIFQQVEHDVIASMPFGRFKLIESGMAEYYGVSRTVTGDLLARLQERGLVERVGRSQSQVPALTEQLMTDLYDVRALLEPAALISAAPFIAASDLEQMRDEIRTAETRYPDGDLEQLDTFEHELHVSFLELAPNKRLLGALRTSQLPLLATNYLLKRYLGAPEQEPFLAEHRLVVELLLLGATAAAASALEAHLRSACQKGIGRVKSVRLNHEPTSLPFLQPMDQRSSMPRPAKRTFVARAE